MVNKPLKRHTSLQPLSCEHHYSLQLCWKIRTGLKKQSESDRVKKYLNWFWETHLKSHFEIEELYIFPILGEDHELIKKALAEHRRLTSLFETPDDNLKNLNMIEEELQSHIRFEERILFKEIQTIASAEQLQRLYIHHTESKFSDNLTDPFWE